MFESLRAELGDSPLRIDSAYRTIEHQKSIYRQLKRRPALGSRHLSGEALDIKRPTLYNGDSLRFNRTVSQWAKGNADCGAVGYYNWGVHVDCRPKRSNGAITAWASDRRLLP